MKEVTGMRRTQNGYTKEGTTPADILSDLRSQNGRPEIASLKNRMGAVSFLTSRSAKQFAPLREVPLSGIVASMFGDHLEQDNKDANALMWGDCRNARCNAGMQSMEAFAFDCDGAVSLEVLKLRVKASGYTALLYTTYSHGKMSTKVPCDGYERFAEINDLPFPPTQEAMGSYLLANGLSHLQNIDFDLKPKTSSRYIITGSKTCYVVFHDPVDKVRVVVFLSDTMPLTGENGVGIDGYKALYDRAAVEIFGPDALNLIDMSCRNPCQPIYLPAKPSATAVEHQIVIFDGRLWDWHPGWREVADDLDKRRAGIAERRRQFEETSLDDKICQLVECLKHIPADDYVTWIRCLLAIFNETEGSEEGLKLAHDWSATVADKYDEDAVDRKWTSFAETSIGANRVGLGTLVFLARNYQPDFRLGENHSDFDLGLIGF